MRILVFAPTVGFGGVTRVVETITHELARQKVDFTILGQTYNESGQRIQWPENVPFIQVKPVDRLPNHPHQFEFLTEHGHEFCLHAKELEADYDLIWILTPWWSLGARLSVNFDRPVACNIPDFAFDHIDMGMFLTRYFREAAPRIAQLADLTIFSSEFQRQWGMSHYGFRKTAKIHYSMDFTPFPSVNEETLALPFHYLLAFHCISPHKGLATILRAYADLKAMADNDAIPPLVIAGMGSFALRNPISTDQNIQSFRKLMLRELGLRPGIDVFIGGHIRENAFRSLYAGADACLIASRSEGDLSGAIHEALFYQRPLIYSDIPVFRERLQDGVHGLMFPVADHVELARKILDVLVHRQRAEDRAAFAFLDFNKRTVTDVVLDHLKAFEPLMASESKFS